MYSRSPWLVAFTSHPSPARRLVCFPHAGGGTLFFRTWAALMPADVELLVVQYPGRESRLSEPMVRSAAEAARAVADALLAEPACETVLFGHSMGASIAYETLRMLEAAGHTGVSRLCASARKMAGFSEVVNASPRSDDNLLDLLHTLGGTNDVLLANDEFREMLLSIIRDDYVLVDSYRPDPAAAPLRTEVLALVGDSDPRVPAEDVEAWAGVTSAEFHMRVLPGGHFYLAEHTAEVLKLALTPFPTQAPAEPATPGSPAETAPATA